MDISTGWPSLISTHGYIHGYIHGYPYPRQPWWPDMDQNAVEMHCDEGILNLRIDELQDKNRRHREGTLTFKPWYLNRSFFIIKIAANQGTGKKNCGSSTIYVAANRAAWTKKSKTSCAGGRHNMPRPLQADLWPFDLESGVRVMCDVGYLCQF